MVRTLFIGLLVAVGGTCSAQEKRIATTFASPVKDKEWKPNSHKFGEDCSYPTSQEGVMKRWGQHLGEDMNLPESTVIVAAADGKVNYADTLPGKSNDQRSWGGVVILGHWISDSQAIYTLYGHIKVKPGLKKGDFVRKGDEIGTIAPGPSEENGWWKDSHLHFQVNVDPLDNQSKGILRNGMLTGYAQRNVQGELKDNPAPNRLLDNVAASEVLKAKDPIAFLREAEGDPKRRK